MSERKRKSWKLEYEILKRKYEELEKNNSSEVKPNSEKPLFNNSQAPEPIITKPEPEIKEESLEIEEAPNIKIKDDEEVYHCPICGAVVEKYQDCPNGHEIIWSKE